MTSLVISSLPYSSPVKETLHFYSCICSLKYMTWRFHSQNILKNNLSCLPVLSTTCIGHCWLQRKLWRLHRNERFERYCPKGERMSILLSFSLQTYQLRNSETNRKSQLAWKLGSLELQVQGTVCWQRGQFFTEPHHCTPLPTPSCHHLRDTGNFSRSQIPLHPIASNHLFLDKGFELVRLEPA